MSEKQNEFIEFMDKCETRLDSTEYQNVISMWIPFYKLEEFTRILGSDSSYPISVELLDNSIYVNILDYVDELELDREFLINMFL